MKELSKEILDFLEKYAVRNSQEADDYTSPYSSPDADELFAAAKLLELEQTPIPVYSSWESGGYKPYSSKEGREWHDSLVKKINFLADKK
ncbi:MULTISPECIES: hypothetical protein [Nostocales]|uniref:Uncharacterized protein n=2 Tax=Tolypothrix TaxID=111782 RepID=A0A0C1R1Z5_9CYAN